MQININNAPRPENPRLESLHIRLNQEELGRIKGYAEDVGMGRAEYVRHQALKATQKIKVEMIESRFNLDEYRELTRLRRELIAQGNNLNQIARAINLANQQGRAIEIDTNALAQIAKTNNEIGKELLELTSGKR